MRDRLLSVKQKPSSYKTTQISHAEATEASLRIEALRRGWYLCLNALGNPSPFFSTFRSLSNDPTCELYNHHSCCRHLPQYKLLPDTISGSLTFRRTISPEDTARRTNIAYFGITGVRMADILHSYFRTSCPALKMASEDPNTIYIDCYIFYSCLFPELHDHTTNPCE